MSKRSDKLQAEQDAIARALLRCHGDKPEIEQELHRRRAAIVDEQYRLANREKHRGKK